MEKDHEAGRSGPIPHLQRVLHQGALNDDIINHPYRGSGTEDDPFLVTWIDNDPVNPMNYSTTMKWSITILVAIATLAVAFVSSAYSGGIAEVLREFQISQIVGTLGISLFVLGFAIGPLAWAPLSGKYLALFISCTRRLLTLPRTVRTSVPVLWYLHVSHCLQRRCRRLPEHRDSDYPEILGWFFWLLAVDQCWRCHCRHVSCISERFSYESLRCCSDAGTCHWPNW